MSAGLEALAARVREALGHALTGHDIKVGELTLAAQTASIPAVIGHLRTIEGFNTLIDICGVDWPERRARFDVVYHLLSMTQNLRVRVKIAVADGEAAPSVTGVFPSADWFEREAFDMYGILFEGHPDLRRILTDYGFEGYPLRKDFPLTGYVEVRYDVEQKKVVYEPVKLNQEYRNFDFLSPWEGMLREPQPLPGDEKAAR